MNWFARHVIGPDHCLGLLHLGLGLAIFSCLQPAQSAEQFFEWRVNCNERLYCIGKTSGASQSGQIMQFKLERGNKPDSKIFITVAPEYDLEVGMRVDIDVTDLDYGAFGNISKLYDGNEMAFIHEVHDNLVKKLQEGRYGQISVDYGGSLGQITYDVSLDGVTSVLAYMDEMQGRVERVDAAVLRGGVPSQIKDKDQPKDEVAAKPKDRPKDIVQPPQDHDNVIAHSEETEDALLGQVQLIYNLNALPDEAQIYGYRTYNCDFPNVVEAYGAQQIDLEPGVQLYLVPCNSGDLGPDFYSVLIDAGQGISLDFELPIDFNQDNGSFIMNPEWSQNDYELTGFYHTGYDRDCGVFERHKLQFDQNNGFYFELLEYREKEICDGRQIQPKDYPLVWTIDELGG